MGCSVDVVLVYDPDQLVPCASLVSQRCLKTPRKLVLKIERIEIDVRVGLLFRRAVNFDRDAPDSSSDRINPSCKSWIDRVAEQPGSKRIENCSTAN